MSAAASQNPLAQLETVLTCLRAQRLDASTDATFHLAVATALTEHHIAFEREVWINGIHDFLCAGGIGIVLRTSGTTAEVGCQLWRIARDERIAALVLVTTRFLHQCQPAIGKPLRVHFQRESWPMHAGDKS